MANVYSLDGQAQKIIVIAVFFLCFLANGITNGACPSGPSCPGCYTKVNLNDVKSRTLVQDLVKVAFNSEKWQSMIASGGGTAETVTYSLDKSRQNGGIKDASSQVVAGTMFCIEFYVIPSTCAGQNSPNGCQSSRKLCKAKIWEQIIMVRGAPLTTVEDIKCEQA